MRYFCSLLTAVLIPLIVFGQSSIIEREFRGSWVTTAWGLDWPSFIGGTMEAQMDELNDLLDFHEQQNLNAVVFQVSARGDAIYESQELPWSYVLTGQPGKDPGWDPLSVLIEEAHKRGIEVHAWFNVFAAAYNSSSDNPDSSETPNIRFTKPEWMVHITDDQDNEHIWLNPGIPEARNWQVQNVAELVENYDLDGVHFDRIRYFSSDGYEGDEELFSSNNPQHISDIEDWRRYNVTEFVRSASEVIRDINPKIKIGAAISGHYNYQSSDGWPARYGYNHVYAESRYWTEQGYVDYLSPMNYWSIDTAPRFDYITADWADNLADSTHIYMGIAAYKQDVFMEVDRQIDITRQPNIYGQLYYRYKNISNINDRFSGRYNNPALIPSLPGKPGNHPARVKNLVSEHNSSSVTLTWSAPDDTARYKYAIYRSDDESGSQKTLEGITGRQNYTIPLKAWMDSNESTAEIAVHTVDWNYRESDPAVTTVTITSTSTSTSTSGDEMVAGFRLHQNYPNPFNPKTHIQFDLHSPKHTTLKVYDMTGREVAVLVSDYLQAGSHSVPFDRSGLASGIYIYRLQSGDLSLTKRMTLIK